jgi:hypothetical protein
VLDWFRRIRKVSGKLSLPSRESGSGRSQIQLNPSKLTPPQNVYLSHFAQVQFTIAYLMQDDSLNAPTADIREAQLEISKKYKQRGQETEALIVKSGASEMDLQAEIRDRLDLLIQRTEGLGWHEDLMRIYIVFGLLEDSLHKVAKGLNPSRRIKIESLMLDRVLESFCQEQLANAIRENPEIGGRLAMFGRMVVADTLLEIRDSVNLQEILPQDPPSDPTDLAREQFKALEPFTSELISEHTLRMDRLGLTA